MFERCPEHRPRAESFRIETFPEVLIIQLKRFSMDFRNKLNTPVSAPLAHPLTKERQNRKNREKILTLRTIQGMKTQKPQGSREVKFARSQVKQENDDRSLLTKYTQAVAMTIRRKKTKNRKRKKFRNVKQITWIE